MTTSCAPTARVARIARIDQLPGLKHALACGALLAACGLSAQTLSSPIASSPAPAGAKPAATAPGFDLPVGQGPGVHGANSPFPPLAARTDVVPWSMLTSVKTKTEKNRILPVFNLDQMTLNQKTQRIQGFMMPLDPGEKQKHFLLSSVPLTCAFCLPGGPESMVEVKTKTPVKYSMEPVVVEGRFLVLNDDSYGLYYRITDATSVK
ncbi:hypothetical protein SAMN05216350_107155 [Polaromonas sp. YR568]|uniref:DUF3299 domain-containing protein n=1 Tax=Polaromonas sp. YR568 TaxID=1855301 RepID=UPI0008E15401|nr:DUF3299 domain-containing protein [Polaromonas sp. YR568]SFU89155.1 hypothetical protein SAMN05216350_107155 [Polaromonas sp. YR568]